ncbi:hypothetical protein ACHAWC_006938 [Mediolabrus comicus]
MSCSSPMKRRKENDGRAAETGAQNVNTNNNYTNDGGSENLSQKMDRMMQIMMGMKEKLDNISSLERRCEHLEAKCSTLENILENNTQSMKEHVDSKITKINEATDSLHAKIDQIIKRQEYNDMLVKNQSWKYLVDVLSVDEWVNVADLTEDEAANISEDSKRLREATEKLRRGEFPRVDDNYNEKGITLEEIEPSVENYLLPYWREFAEALKQFTPAFGVLPDDWESYFHMEDVDLNNDAMLILRDALINKPFHTLSFINNDRDADVGGMSVDAIMDIVDSNKHLRQLDIEGNLVDGVHIGKICSVVLHTHPFLVCLDLSKCFRNGAGDEMMISLLTTSGTLKLEKLVMAFNDITSNVTTLLTDYLAADPQMKWLDLRRNILTDNDAELLANALRSNTTLRHLDLGLFYNESTITDVGAGAFCLVLNDERNLNSAALSNHSCHIPGVGPPSLNKNVLRQEWHEIRSWDMTRLRKETEMNRAQKIYNLLYSRNKSLTNVQHFDGIDVQILPNMVEAVQRYSGIISEQCEGEVEQHYNAEDLSIVYEVMRKWDKVFSLYGGRLD